MTLILAEECQGTGLSDFRGGWLSPPSPYTHSATELDMKSLSQAHCVTETLPSSTATVQAYDWGAVTQSWSFTKEKNAGKGWRLLENGVLEGDPQNCDTGRVCL